jgi:hypothetical protein
LRDNGGLDYGGGNEKKWNNLSYTTGRISGCDVGEQERSDWRDGEGSLMSLAFILKG